MLSTKFLVRTFSLFAIAIIALSACNTTPGKPTVVIISPASGSEFQDGDTISVQSASVDSTGISRVELVVDNVVVRTDTSPVPQGQPSLALTQAWKATQGNHVIVVRAYNTAGAMSDPVAVAVSITSNTGQVAPTATSIVPPPLTLPTTAPTQAPQPTSTSVPGTAACVNDSAYVADVTVPDGTKFAPGQTFNKIWRISNSGSCPWGAGYQLVYVSGTAMTTSTAVNVPATAPGATADVTVPMTAPATGGSFTGVWRMKNASGTFFGKNVTVVISVATSSSSSSSATSSSASGCTGTPTIASFTASTSTIPAASAITVLLGATVTLNWGLVSNADSASIDQGIGGIVTPSTRTVNPTTTTTYTLTATCGSNTQTAQVKVTVVTLPPPVMLVYDFVANPNASGVYWQNSTSAMLTFPGTGTESAGFVRYVTSPSSKMEDGSTPSRCLETHPNWITNGLITGTYTNLASTYVAQSSDHFYATVGFIYGAKSGSNDAYVAFKVWFRSTTTGNHPFTYNHAYNGSLVNINVDLSPYAGQHGDFILEVDALNPFASRDWACWVSAGISR